MTPKLPLLPILRSRAFIKHGRVETRKIGPPLRPSEVPGLPPAFRQEATTYNLQRPRIIVYALALQRSVISVPGDVDRSIRKLDGRWQERAKRLL